MDIDYIVEKNKIPLWFFVLVNLKDKSMEQNSLEIVKFVIFAVLTIGSTYLAFKADDYRKTK